MALPWAGFSPLRNGCVHVWCPKCHRKLSNMPRQQFDPERATLVHSFCERCSQGCKDSPEWYFDDEGKQIGWDEIEAAIEAATSDGASDVE